MRRKPDRFLTATIPRVLPASDHAELLGLCGSQSRRCLAGDARELHFAQKVPAGCSHPPVYLCSHGKIGIARFCGSLDTSRMRDMHLSTGPYESNTSKRRMCFRSCCTSFSHSLLCTFSGTPQPQHDLLTATLSSTRAGLPGAGWLWYEINSIRTALASFSLTQTC